MSQKTKVLLAFTGIFVAGAVAGSVVALRVGVAKVEQARVQQGTAPVAVVTPDQFAVRQMQQFTRDLSLTPEQTKSIQPIINSTSEKLNTLRDNNAKDTAEIVKAMDNEVGAVLTTDQRKMLAESRSKWQSRMDNQFKPSGFGGRRGGGGQQEFRPGTNSSFGPGSSSATSGPGRSQPRRSGGPPSNQNSSPVPAPADKDPV